MPDAALLRALVRWQHAAGPYWPYVCAAPFVSGTLPTGIRVDGRPRVRSARERELVNAVRAWIEQSVARDSAEHPRLLGAAGPRDEHAALSIDLDIEATLALAPELSAGGWLVVPVVQRWATEPAVLPTRRLIRLLMEGARRIGRPTRPRGVVLLADGGRAGSPLPPDPRSRRFDNRYGYQVCRFPSPAFLAERGVRTVHWLTAGRLAADLAPYASDLLSAGIEVTVTDMAEVLGCGAEAPGRGRAGSCAAGTGTVSDGREFSVASIPGGMAHSLTLRMHPAAGPDVASGSAPRADGSTIMRALVVDPAAIDPALYRRFVRRAQVDALLPDHFVRGEPYLALNAVVLAPADVDELRRLTETFAPVLHAAGRGVQPDVPFLMEMGFPWAAAELLAQEQPRMPLVGRFDFVKARDGRWRLLEYNADTPSGVREAITCERLVKDLVPDAWRVSRVGPGLSEALRGAFARALADIPAGGTLGLITTAGELEDLAQMAFTRDLLAPTLAARGMNIVLGDAENLAATRHGLTLLGRPIDALYRYLPIEGIFGRPTFAAMADAVARGRVRALNGQYGLLLQNKALLARMWADRDGDRFGAAERAAIRDHLPATWTIDAVPEGVERGALVAKQVFGREGQEVFFGEDTDDATWRALVARRTYVAQERVAIEPLRAVIQTSLGSRVWDGHATVGCFAVDGRFAGCYTRFGGKIVTSRSKWLATFVDDGARCTGSRDA